jgi:hypothetical protein
MFGRTPVVTSRQCAEGLASFAIGVVALLGIVMALGNLALWLYAQNVVVAAAQEAAVIASRENGTPALGQQTAQALLVSSLGPGASHVRTVDIRVDADLVTAEIRGEWPVVLMGPLVNAPLHATASLARERFRPGGR